MMKSFDPKTDIPVLLRCLEELRDHYGLNAERMVAAVKHYRAKRVQDGNGALTARGVISRTSLQKFMTPPHTRPQEGERLRDIWDCIGEHPHFRKALVEAIGVEEPVVPLAQSADLSEEAALSLAMTRFFQREKVATDTQFEDLCERYPGRYIMYRADLRPYVMRIDSLPRFRASVVTIEHVEGALLITEEQDFPKTDTDPEFYMKTTGIFVPYGKHKLFFSQALVREPFRCGVVNREYSFSNNSKVGFFQGTILVASSEDMFPATAFFCLRDDGTLETGLIPFERIYHVDARIHLQHAHEVAALDYEKRRSVTKL